MWHDPGSHTGILVEVMGCKYGYSYLEQIRGPLFSSWIGSHKQVLDLGCRDGTLTKWYAQDNEVTCVDIDNNALAKAALVCKQTIACDIDRTWPFSPETFDVIVAGEVFEHLKNAPIVVQDCWRTLRRGGLLIGSMPNELGWRYVLRRDKPSPVHCWLASRELVDRFLYPVLFEDITTVPMGLIKGKRLPPMIMRFFPVLAQGWAFCCRK